MFEERLMEQDREYKISVVTAVYNVEEYLGDMIESIIAQTTGFENVQLVLVDDGSTDRSGEICDQYADMHPDNIVAVRKENGGVSSARNEGLRHAKGEYVNFTDADDMLEENALQLMYGHLRENGEWIDLCAIPFRLFGARNGSHPLNYRFEAGTRIVLKCTGMPRYDHLYDNADAGRSITFMPTWRKYLTGNLNVDTDLRRLEKEFGSSVYCRMYQQVFSERRLYEAAEKYHYEIQLMLHPAMPRECQKYFHCDDRIRIFRSRIRHRKQQ